MRPRRSTIPFLVLLAPIVFVGVALVPGVSDSGAPAPRPPNDVASRGKETAAVRLEAAQLTGSPEGMRSAVDSTQPTATLAVTADPEKGAHSATHAQSDWLITLVEPEVPTFQPSSTEFPSLAIDPAQRFSGRGLPVQGHCPRDS